MTRDRSPLRYLPAHALDVVRGPLALFGAITLGISLVVWRVAAGGVAGADPNGGTQFLGQAMSALTTLGALVAAGGVAGNDVQRGFYRAWFSKPMAPWWFYLQRWLLGGVALLLLPLMLGAGFALATGGATGITAELLGVVALGYLMVGGAVFLFSTLTSRDWLVVFILTFAQGRINEIVRMLRRTDTEVPWLLDLVWRILPPFDLITPMKGLPEGSDLAQVLAWGVGMLVVGVLLLVFRPLGSGGRA